MTPGLSGFRVLELSEQIAGPYCGKLFVDAGADVIKVESAAGDRLRQWSSTGPLRTNKKDAGHGDSPSPLFTFLNAGKRSVVDTVDDEHVRTPLSEADLAIVAGGLESDGEARVAPSALHAAHPVLVVLSITPYGRTGPWADRRATEFTLQAESGSIGVRGVMGQQPFQAGGRITEWAAGSYGAVASLPRPAYSPGPKVAPKRLGRHCQQRGFFDATNYLDHVRNSGRYDSRYVESSLEYNDDLIDAVEVSIAK